MANRAALAVISVLILLSMSALSLAISMNANASEWPPSSQITSPPNSLSLTVQLCEVRQGNVNQSSCSSTVNAGDYTALYISATQTGSVVVSDAAVTITGSSGVPLAWTTAWNQQTSCGASVCENGFYGAITGSSGAYSGYSYCSPTMGSSCDYTGQGATSAPPAGSYTVTVCVQGGPCASGSVTTTGTTTTSTTTTTTARSATIEMCQVSSGSVVSSSCSSTLPAGEYASLQVTASGLATNAIVSISGSSGFPIAWTTAWNFQTDCGNSNCMNGFYLAQTDSQGSYTGNSYCSPITGSACRDSGQGAAPAPAAGAYTVTVCTGSICATGTVTTTGTASAQVTLTAASVGSSVFLNATVNNPGAAGFVVFSGSGPSSASFPAGVTCSLNHGTCSTSVQLAAGSWAIEATYASSQSTASVTVAGISTPSGCFGNNAISTGSNDGTYLYVSDEYGNSVSQYGILASSGQLCSLGPPTPLPSGTAPQSLVSVGAVFNGLTAVSGTLLVPSGSRDCWIGLSADPGDGHLVYGTSSASASPGAPCFDGSGGFNQPIAATFVGYDNTGKCGCLYVLNAGSSTISTYYYGSGYVSRLSVAAPQDPIAIVSSNFDGSNFHLSYSTQECVFADDSSAIQGYVESGGPLTPFSPFVNQTAGFGAMLTYPAAGQETMPPVLYVVSPTQDEIYVFQVQSSCELALMQTLHTGLDPVGLVTADVGNQLFVLNQGEGNVLSSISSYFIQSNGELLSNGAATIAGADALAIGGGDILGNYSPYYQNAGFFYVADGGQSTIDEYSVSSTGLPQYIGSIQSTLVPGDSVNFAAGFAFDVAARYQHVAWNEFGTTSLACATQGSSYSYSIPITQGGNDSLGPTSVYSGSLPTGLTLSAGGTISGTPSSTGVFTFSVEQTGTDSILLGLFSLTVMQSGCPGISSVQTTTTTTASTMSTMSSSSSTSSTSASTSSSSSSPTSTSNFTSTSSSNSTSTSSSTSTSRSSSGSSSNQSASSLISTTTASTVLTTSATSSSSPKSSTASSAITAGSTTTSGSTSSASTTMNSRVAASSTSVQTSATTTQTTYYTSNSSSASVSSSYSWLEALSLIVIFAVATLASMRSKRTSATRPPAPYVRYGRRSY